MVVFTLAVLIALSVAFLLFCLIRMLATRAVVLRNAATPFECGFDPKGSARTPFSLRFFLLAVIFLIFDVEVVILFPTLFIISSADVVAGVGAVLAFLTLLLGGLFHEWREGSLNWA